jgi:hypothetical protein
MRALARSHSLVACLEIMTWGGANRRCQATKARAAEAAACADTAFSQSARVATADGVPLAEVRETYSLALVCN